MTLEQAKERARRWHKGFRLDYAVRRFCPYTDLTEGYQVMALSDNLQVMAHRQRIVWCIRAGRV